MIRRVIFLLFCLLPLSAGGAEKIVLDSLRVIDEQLVVDFHLQGIADEKMQRGIQRGLTSEIIYTLQLWQKRTLISRLVTERETRVTLFYDNWESKYALVSEFEKRLTDDWNKVYALCSQVVRLPAFACTDLKSGTEYYVVIQASIQPISDQAYHELTEWVAGQQRDTVGVQEKSRAPMFDWFVDLLGFGDRSYSVKSPDFILGMGGLDWVE